MPDTFADRVHGLESPAARAALVTPDDSTDLAFTTRAIMVGVNGTLRVTTAGGDTLTLPASCVTAGMLLPIRVARVHATGTTASDILAVW
jgi:hypothetical protein